VFCERVPVLTWPCADVDAGYGFVDFDSEQAAELAVKALKAEGRQAQMARVCVACWFSFDTVD